MTLFDLDGLLAALSTARARFVVIGGVAVAAHAYIRATEDLDIVPDPTPDNLDALANVLVSLDGRLTLRPDQALGSEERSALDRGRNLSVTTRLGDVDVVQRLPGVPNWETLWAAASQVRVGESDVAVCSLRHLVEMKRARGSMQDLADIERLEPA